MNRNSFIAPSILLSSWGSDDTAGDGGSADTGWDMFSPCDFQEWSLNYDGGFDDYRQWFHDQGFSEADWNKYNTEPYN